MIPLKWWLESTQRKVNREIRWLCRLEQMGTNWFSWKIRCTKGQPERNFVQPKTYYLNIMPPLASLTHSDFSFPKARIFSTPQTWDQKHPLSFGDSSPAPEAKGSVSHKSDQISDWESDIGGAWWEGASTHDALNLPTFRHGKFEIFKPKQIVSSERPGVAAVLTLHPCPDAGQIESGGYSHAFSKLSWSP